MAEVPARKRRWCKMFAKEAVDLYAIIDDMRLDKVIDRKTMGEARDALFKIIHGLDCKAEWSEEWFKRWPLSST